MKSEKTNILHTYAAALLSLLFCIVFAACSSDDAERDGGAGKDAVRIVFTLALDDPQTRAADTGWSDYDPKDDGSTMENTIDPSRFHVVFYDAEGRCLGLMEDLELAPTDKQNVYQVYGNIEVSDSAIVDRPLEGKVMVFANCDTPLQAGWTLSSGEIRNMAYTFSLEPSAIPMWGVKSLGGVTLQPGATTNLGDISLLRAMAKVDVSLDESLKNEGYTLKNAVLSRHNRRGYCLPAGYVDVDETAQLTFAQTLNVMATLSEDSIEFAGKELYIPEYRNTDAANVPATITVVLAKDGSEDATYTLRFVDYDSNGAPTDNVRDIVRNHWYRYTLYKKNSSKERGVYRQRGVGVNLKVGDIVP